MTEAPATPVALGPCEAVAQEIRKYGDWDHNIMTAIAKSENDTCDPLRHNETLTENHKTCVGSYGVLQVGCIHYIDYGYALTEANKNDLALNVQIAHKVWQKQGYTAWTEYRNGGYRKHLA